MWVVLLTSTPRLLTIELEVCRVPGSIVTQDHPIVYDSMQSLEEDLEHHDLSQEDFDHTIIAVNIQTLETQDISYLFDKENIHATPHHVNRSSDTDVSS